MDDIRDIRPPVETAWIVWLLMAALVIVIGAAIYYFFRRFKKKPISLPPWDKALLDLSTLEGKDYPRQLQFKAFYSELSLIIRQYLEGRFQINAPEMTTEEFLNHCQSNSALTADHKNVLKEFLNGCDLVKFAKHEPTQSDARHNFDLAQKLVLDTKPVDTLKHGV